MTYLILSDLHANRHAFDAVMEDAQRIGYDAVIVLGDLVGYGADPAAVVERTLALNAVAMVRGNHDKVCAGLEPAALFNDVARRSIEWTALQLPVDLMQHVKALPQGPVLVTPTLAICHGSPFDEDYYIFETDDARRAMETAGARICLFGHTHLPVVFATKTRVGDPPPNLAEDEMALPEEGPILINVGSVGQPRDGDPRAAYGLIDLERQVLRMRRVPYDIEGAQARILSEGLPPALAARLARGQ